MDKSKAIGLLKQALAEIPHLKELHHDNQEFKLWDDKVLDIIKAGLDRDDAGRFLAGRQYLLVGPGTPDGVLQKHYLEDVNRSETALKSIIQKYEILGLEAEPAAAAVAEPVAPKAFIAHGGESPAREKLSIFLNALAITPIIAEDQPSQGRSIDENVEYYLRQCDCAIILATKGDVDGHTGEFIPRGNILVEIGRSQELFANRMVYLLEEEAKFPTNIAEKVWERFTQDNMEKAFIKVAKELRAFGLIKAVKA